MSDSINIRQLQQASDIEPGDYILIENTVGTAILDFKDFVITEDNTTFYPLLSTHTSDISRNFSLINTLSTEITTISGIWSRPDSTKVHTSRHVGIGTSAPSELLSVGGNISANGGLSATGSEYSYIESRLGVGRSDPGFKIHAYSDEGTTSYIKAQAVAGEAGFVIHNTQAEWYIFADDNSLNNSSPNACLNFWSVQGNTTAITFTSASRIGVGTTSPETNLHLAGNAGITLNIRDNTDPTPANPTANTEARIYTRQHYLVIQYNDGGTIRYKSLPLSGTGIAWEHSTSAP